MEYLIAAGVSLLVAIAIAIPWVRAIEKRKNDPEWQEHKDDPDYWGWPLTSGAGGNSQFQKIQRRELSL